MTSERLTLVGKWLLSGFGVLVLLYCLFILGFVVTSPDLGLRCVLSDDPLVNTQPGPEIKRLRLIPAADVIGAVPHQGDFLLSIRRESIGTFMDFTRQLIRLRSQLRKMVAPGGKLDYGDTPLGQGDLLPPIVEIGDQQWVEVEFQRQDSGAKEKCWLRVQSLPVGEVVLSFVWFILEFGIFMVGALAFWTRPFDLPARLFFAMCIVTVGAFVGGYHWWVIAGSLWLTIPFTICAMLVPVVTLHFFLKYPQPKSWVATHPRTTVVTLYAIPVAATVLLLAIIGYSSWIYGVASNVEIRDVLHTMTQVIHAYLLVAAAYFMATLFALLNSFFTTRNPVVHSQVKWILWAAVVATIPVGYTLYLAQFDKVEFALGEATVPMFTASLLFMLAYAVGIVRYKLMLVEQILSRGMLYYVVSLLATAVYSLAIASSSLMGMHQHVELSQQALSVIATVTVTVVLLGWFRDRLQRIIDRRFFREKYQLDKALQRMNQAVGQLVEPGVLAERLLASCRDVLGVSRASLYLRDASREVFQLIATDATDNPPLQFPIDEAWLSLLQENPNLQRLSAVIHVAPSPSQKLLRELKFDLAHALEVEGDLAGIVLLGAKRNGTPYTAEDLTFLTALGQITSVALHSAKVHQAVSRLNEQLRSKVDKIAEQQRLISMLQAEIMGRQPALAAAPEAESFQRDLIKGDSAAIRGVLETVRKVSNSQSSVMIRGESGTGKELLAQAIHQNSPRRGGPIVSVHCGALSPGLLESELFGHVKGAFTGAHRDRIGRFELANGGTLFLDEIGDISLDTQIKLLRVLQERTFEPVGSARTMQVDVRLIAATHQNLESLIAEGKFREDLFYRLNVISITLPPLREREDDIFELALHFLGRASQAVGKQITHLDEDAVDALRRYPWPGNIRELENALERAVVLADGPSISVDDLPPRIVQHRSAPRQVVEAKPGRSQKVASTAIDVHVSSARSILLEHDSPGDAQSEALERNRLLNALHSSGGNKAEAARLLGMPRSTFFSKLKKYVSD